MHHQVLMIAQHLPDGLNYLTSGTSVNEETTSKLTIETLNRECTLIIMLHNKAASVQLKVQLRVQIKCLDLTAIKVDKGQQPIIVM